MGTAALVAWIAAHDVGTIFHRVVGEIAVRHGRAEVAQRHLDVLVTASERSPERRRLAADLLALGTVYREQGRLGQSGRELERALEVLPDDTESDAPTRSGILSELTEVYQELGLPDQALASAEAWLRLAESTFAEGHVAVARVLETLAMVHAQRGSLDLAEAFQRRALSIRETDLGSQHPEVALAMTRLGHVLLYRGRFRQASLYLERSVSLLRAAGHRGERGWLPWSETRPDVSSMLASSLNELGLLYREQGRVGEAKVVYAEALGLTANAATERAAILANASMVSLQMGQVQEARHYSEEALEIAKKVEISPALRALLDDTAAEIRLRMGEAAKVVRDRDDPTVIGVASNARAYPMVEVTRVPRSSLRGVPPRRAVETSRRRD